VLEGQSIAVVPPGVDAAGSRTSAPVQHRQRAQRRAPGYNNVSLTIKRVLEDHEAGRCAAWPATTCAT
jgi:benzoyl-CoA 2,3-dioxygenase component A